MRKGNGRVSGVRLAGAACVLGLAELLMPGKASAAYSALDNASDPAYSSGWNNLTNGGTGFGAWQLSPTTNGGSGGFFIGDSTENGGGGSGNPGSSGGINSTSADSFGIYANSGVTASAYRPFTGAMLANQIFNVSIDNGYINNPGSDGISLLSGGSGGAIRFEFYFNGGSSDYTLQDATGTHDSGIGYTDGGLNLSFAPTSASTYSLSVTPASGGSTSTFTGNLIGSPSSYDIDTFRAFDFNSGGGGTPLNFYVNNLAIVPEPTSLAGIITAGMLLLGRKRRSTRDVISK